MGKRDQLHSSVHHTVGHTAGQLSVFTLQQGTQSLEAGLSVEGFWFESKDFIKT